MKPQERILLVTVHDLTANRKATYWLTAYSEVIGNGPEAEEVYRAAVTTEAGANLDFRPGQNICGSPDGALQYGFPAILRDFWRHILRRGKR